MALRRFVVPLALALSLSSVALAAPSPQDRTEAAQLTIKSRAAAQKKNLPEAIDLARKADTLDPTAARKIELAKMLVDGGKLVEASQILNALVNDPALPASDKWAKDAAKKQLGTFESRIPWLTVIVNGPTKGVHVEIDGKEAEAGAETPVDPGEHAIGADAEGYDSADTKITVPEGAHKSVSLTLNVAPNSKPKEEKPAESSGGSLLATKWPALAAGGVGVAGLALGAVFGVLAFNEADKARSFCKGNVCPNLPEVVDARNVSIANGNVSTAGFIVGGIGLAGGAALWFLLKPSGDKSKDEPKKDAVTVQPYVGVGSAGFVGTF
ncbi:MAG: hypothetical protein U0441_01310 [Polyangiaceae bacterium]